MKQFYTLFLLCFALSSFSQTIINLPATPQTYQIPAAWRGNNLSATALMTWLDNPGFQNAFQKLHAGPLRWPHGNRANNFDWQANLSNNGYFNLKNASTFVNQQGASLQMVVNFGNGSATEAADFVRFCNSNSQPWPGQRQSLLGNSSPIGVKYWEIGNEVTTPWGFGWSWLGHQDNIFFRSGASPKVFTQSEADDLYYFGGSLWREGWVEKIGGLTNNTAILGTLRNIQNAVPSINFKVDFPQLDVNDPIAVRVWITPNFDVNWGESTNDMQMLYDSLTSPWNALPTSMFSWTSTDVNINPPGNIPAGSVILVEYNSINHDGAFAFRNAMKAADSSIEIGYETVIKPAQSNDPVFQAAFAASPPNFMIKHSYSGNQVSPNISAGRFSEVAYLPVQLKQSFVDNQAILDGFESSWGIPNDVGFAYTEWNIALCDNCPPDHPFDGIVSAMYVASFWGNMFESAIAGNLDIRTINQFALLASGSNFIHQYHVNNGNFIRGNEAYATEMAMQSIGKEIFAINNISNMAQITIQNGSGTQVIDALQLWGGVDADSSYYTLLILNRDDQTTQDLILNFPSSWQVNQASIEDLSGQMTNGQLSHNYRTEFVPANTLNLTLPRYSITVIKVNQGMVLPVDLLDFTGQYIDEKVKLIWTTADEINLKEYIVERSSDNRNFNPTGVVTASKKSSYHFMDIPSEKGTFLYRLKMLNNDESYHYSPTVSVEVPYDDLILRAAYFQTDNLILKVELGHSQQVSFLLSNPQGQILNHFSQWISKGEHLLRIPQTALPFGIYFLQIQTQGRQTQVIKVKK